MAAYYSNFNISKREVDALISQAEKGDGAAAVKLGVMYKHGDSVPVDMVKARYYSEAAAKMGILEGALNLGKLYMDEGNVDEGIKILSELTSNQVEYVRTAAAFNLGAYYSSVENYTKAKKYYIIAANSGLDIALHNLGIVYAKLGEYEKAQRMWAMAAAKGNVASMYNYGMGYINGEGTTQDTNNGIKYILQSGKKGFEPAVVELRRLFQLPKTMPNVQVLGIIDRYLAYN